METGRRYVQRCAVSSEPVVDDVQLCLAPVCLMHSAANMYIHCLLTGAANAADGTRQHAGFLALLRLPLDLWARPLLLVFEALVKLFFSALLFNRLVLGRSTKVFRVRGLKPFSRWSLDSSAYLASLVLFAVMIRYGDVLVKLAAVGDWVHNRPGLLGRRLRMKKIGVNSSSKWGWELSEKIARAMIVWAWMCTIHLYNELTRLGVCDAAAIVCSKAKSKYHVTILRQQFWLACYALPSFSGYFIDSEHPYCEHSCASGSRMFKINELGVCCGEMRCSEKIYGGTGMSQRTEQDYLVILSASMLSV